MKRSILILFIILSTLANVTAKDINKIIPQIGKQLQLKNKIFDGRYPEYTIDGKWKFRKKVNWFSGFTAGEFWQLYHITKNESYKKQALELSDALLPFAKIDYTHDMGFIFVPSCVEAYKQTGDKKYRQAGLDAAKMLAKRFNKNGNFIRAWGKLGSEKKAGWMIIDTMMNLELLFWAAKESGNHDYYDIAYRHALTTLDQTVRADASSFHVVEFDVHNGDVVKKRTHQGATDSSTWARGQAWGVYGFANAFLHTGNERFRATSIRMADYMLQHLPQDLIPYWDLNLSDENEPRDASAAAVLASGLYLLSEQVAHKTEREKYLTRANKIVESLLDNYLFLNSKREIEQGLLIHSVYNYHSGWGVDESYPAGDYYLMEALSKYWDYQNQQQQIKDTNKRQTISLNKNWYYLQDNEADINQLTKSSEKWQCINLPHTWNAFDATDNLPGYRRSASWYEKNIFVPKLNKNQRILLYFEGVNIVSDVYVNGRRAGGHIGGYLGFEVDVTDYLKFGKDNQIQVRVDNSYNPDVIPSQKSDFFIFGGITRDVWLKVVPQTYIQSARIRTAEVNAKNAQTEIYVQLNANNSIATGKLNIKITAPSGKILKHTAQIKNLNSDENIYKIKLPPIKKPELWSPEQPNLYCAEIQLVENEKVIDQVQEKFGLRWFEFKENGPFYLNGERLLLRGTHRHEEHAGFGAAMPNQLHRKDMQMIKEMGANFVRLAHYPQDPEVYKACDSLGILVWDEVPWCRGGMGGELWKKNTKSMLKEMILQNYNHPSIVIWSLGNELNWLPDFEGGANDDSLRAFLKEMHDISHAMDPERVTAVRKYEGAADIVDVFSPSIWAGWYSGVYKNYEKAISASRKKFPHFFHAEYGGSSHLGRHDENPVSGEGLSNPDGWEEDVQQAKVKNIARSGDWSENYIVDLFDWHLRVSEQSDWLSGNAQWAFKDFGTPLRPENAIPYINQKGLVDRAGNPKDAWYVFKSYWTKSPQFCYIESHSWTERMGPPEKKREVSVFSNCSNVELFLNGNSLGTKIRDMKKGAAAGLRWDVLFNEGTNKLVAKGFDNKKQVCADTLELTYYYSKFSKPENFVLSSRKLENGNILIEAVMRDKDGRRCLDFNDRVYFSLDGDGYLLINYGTPTRSDIIEMANGYAAIEMVPVPGGRAVIEARNQDFKGSYLVVEE